MKRLLFNLLSAVSLLLCIASSAAWLASRWHYFEIIGPFTGGKSLEAGINRGVLVVAAMAGNFPRWQFKHGTSQSGPLVFYHHFGDFGCVSDVYMTAFELPVCCVAGIWIALAWGCKCIAGRKFVCGLCQQCGYDLRATPDRCPECGTPAKPTRS